jgi:Tfp pilus assembly protein PilX
LNDRSLNLNTNKHRPGAKRGFVLIVVIVLLSLCVTLFGVWARAVLRERSRVANQQLQAQAVRLAEAGVHRAIVRLAADGKYQGETWSVPASDLDKTHAAEVRIRIVPNDGDGKTRYEATAEFPVGKLHRAQFTKSVELPDPVPKE